MITDELREWAKKLTHWWYDPVKNEYVYTTNIMPLSIDTIRLDERLVAIADRIDAEHEEALREAYTKGYEDGVGVANAKDAQAEYLRGKNDGYDEGWDAGFASADDWLAQYEDAMAEHGWYRALDGDKTPIRIGDKVDSDRHEDGTVTGIQFYEMANGGIRTLIAVRPDGWDVATWHTPDEYRHHHAPTVEDVLCELLDKVDDDRAGQAEVIAEYAKRLRLAGDAE